MFELINKIFIGILTSVSRASNHIKCVSLSNQKCMIQPTLISLHSNEYSQKFHYYPFMVKLNTQNDLSNKVCVPNETEDLDISTFNMNTGINESETLTKHISCECKCRFHRRKCNSDPWWNNDKC